MKKLIALSEHSEQSDKRKLIAQGAESKLWLNEGIIIKERVSKSYRIKFLDDFLRFSRTKSESRMLVRASKLINVPKLRKVEGFSISMDFIDAPVLRDVMSRVNDEIFSEVGRIIGVLHTNSIIHGDLTTSNMLVKNGRVFLIDFGLSEVKDSLEAKAVDLHLLKQALESKHYSVYHHAWKLISDSYVKSYVKGGEVLSRLRVVESRGRYKNR